MDFVYRPAGQDGEKTWPWTPGKFMSPEREAIERKTGKAWPVVCEAAIAGDGTCQRAILWCLLRREHPSVRFEELSFSVDEVEFRFDVADLERVLVEIEKRTGISEADRETAVAVVLVELAEARAREVVKVPDGERSGEALPPTGGDGISG